MFRKKRGTNGRREMGKESNGGENMMKAAAGIPNLRSLGPMLPRIATHVVQHMC